MCRLHFQAERLAISRKRYGSLILALATVFTRGQHHVVEVDLAIAIVKVFIRARVYRWVHHIDLLCFLLVCRCHRHRQVWRRPRPTRHRAEVAASAQEGTLGASKIV